MESMSLLLLPSPPTSFSLLPLPLTCTQPSCQIILQGIGTNCMSTNCLDIQWFKMLSHIKLRTDHFYTFDFFNAFVHSWESQFLFTMGTFNRSATLNLNLNYEWLSINHLSKIELKPLFVARLKGLIRLTYVFLSLFRNKVFDNLNFLRYDVVAWWLSVSCCCSVVSVWSPATQAVPDPFTSTPPTPSSSTATFSDLRAICQLNCAILDMLDR